MIVNSTRSIALSAYCPQGRQRLTSVDRRSCLDRVQLIQVSGQSTFTQLQTMLPARALHFAKALFSLVAVEPREQMCKKMPNCEPRAFEFEGGALQVLYPSFNFDIHGAGLSVCLNNSVHLRPRLFSMRLSPQKLSSNYSRSTAAQSYKVVIDSCARTKVIATGTAGGEAVA